MDTVLCVRTEKNPIFRVQVVSWRSVQHLPDRTIPSQLANVCLQPPLQVVYTQYQAQHLLSRYVLSRTPSGNRNNQNMQWVASPNRGGTPFSPVVLIGSQQTRSRSNSPHTAWIHILDDLSPSYLHRQPMFDGYEGDEVRASSGRE